MERLQSLLCGVMAAIILPITTPASGGDFCRSVSRVGYATKAVVGNYAARQVNHYGHGGYAAFVAVEPVYVDVVAADIRQKAASKRHSDQAEELLKLQAQVDLLIRLQGGSQPSQATSAGTLPPEPQADTEVVGILRTHCAKCHSGTGGAGGFTLFEADKTTPLPWGPREKFLAESVVNDNSMPPSGPKLSADEYQAVRKWMEADRAAIRDLLKGGVR